MAAGHGDVHHLEPGREHDPDNDAASAGALDAAGFRTGVQLDMRHADPGRAVHALVAGRDAAGGERCDIDRRVRGHWRASP